MDSHLFQYAVLDQNPRRIRGGGFRGCDGWRGGWDGGGNVGDLYQLQALFLQGTIQVLRRVV